MCSKNLEMTKACIASETWSKAQAEEDDRLTDSAAPARTSRPNQSRVRKQLPHSLHPCPMAQQIAKTTTALHLHRGGGNQRVGRTKTHETRHTTHNTQHTTQTDRSTQPLLLLPTRSQHARLPPAENSSQTRRREVGGENKSDRTDDTIVEEVDRGQTVLRRGLEATRPTGTRRRTRSAGEEVSCLTSEAAILHRCCCSQLSLRCPLQRCMAAARL